MTRLSSPSPGPIPLGLVAGGALARPLDEGVAAAGVPDAVAVVGAVVGAVDAALLGAALAGDTLAGPALAGPVDGFCVGACVAVPDDEHADTIKARMPMATQTRPIRTSPPLPPLDPLQLAVASSRL